MNREEILFCINKSLEFVCDQDLWMELLYLRNHKDELSDAELLEGYSQAFMKYIEECNSPIKECSQVR